MKIAVVGCGAVGSYYGANLCRAGHDVHFLLRSDYEVVRHNGVFIHSPNGDFRVQPKCAKSPEQIGECDLVLIGLKTTANDQFQKLLPPLAGARAAFITLQNGLGNEEQLAKIVPMENIFGGLCFVCLNRTAPGVIHHMSHGLVVIGEFRGAPGPRTQNIADTFRGAEIPCKVTDNLACSHWEKLVWNIPFNGLGVAGVAGHEALASDHASRVTHHGPVLTTNKLLDGGRWENLVRELMLEVIAAARSLGFNLSDSLAEKQIERTRNMGAYKASTLIDFERGQPLELEGLFLEPLRQAEKAGVKVPRLTALCNVLRQLNCSGGL